jgi:hypothetical protein
VVQGKLERWHCSMKNQVLLENYYLPSDLKARIGQVMLSGTDKLTSSDKRK